MVLYIDRRSLQRHHDAETKPWRLVEVGARATLLTKEWPTAVKPEVPEPAWPLYFGQLFGPRRRRVYRAGMGVPVLKMTALTRAFQRCVARAYIHWL